MSDTCVEQTWILQNTAGKSRNAKSLQAATWRDSQREAENVAAVGLPLGNPGPRSCLGTRSPCTELLLLNRAPNSYG